MRRAGLAIDTSLQSWLAWIALTGFEATGQIALKIGAVDASAGFSGWTPLGRIILSPGLFISIACDALGFLVWLWILERHNLSVAVPVSASTYFATIGASYAVLGEGVTPLQILGLAVMGAGLLLVASE